MAVLPDAEGTGNEMESSGNNDGQPAARDRGNFSNYYCDHRRMSLIEVVTLSSLKPLEVINQLPYTVAP